MKKVLVEIVKWLGACFLFCLFLGILVCFGKYIVMGLWIFVGVLGICVLVWGIKAGVDELF